jgi:hypothetical protein
LTRSGSAEHSRREQKGIDLSAAPKPKAAKAKPTHPPRPAPGKPDVAAAHKSIVRRYPKVLAELAK